MRTRELTDEEREVLSEYAAENEKWYRCKCGYEDVWYGSYPDELTACRECCRIGQWIETTDEVTGNGLGD